MTHAIRIHQNGGPEVMSWDEITVGDPGAGQIRIRQTAVGLNFIDVYERTGLYPTPLPHILGSEGAGVVEAVGSGVSELKIGDRVAYPFAQGAYAEARLIAADRVVKLPDSISDETAAAMMLKGLTARYLIAVTYPVQAGDTILVHAAAGGVGLILCQWAAAKGATVIGTVSTQAKADLAAKNGCRYPIVTGDEDFLERVHDITKGKRLPVVYDSVGKDTYLRSLDCLRPRGLLVVYGQASGPIPPLDLSILARKGSLFLTRPTLGHYIATRQELTTAANDLFDAVSRGKVVIPIGQSYQLKDAGAAHRALESRATTGSTVLIP